MSTDIDGEIVMIWLTLILGFGEGTPVPNIPWELEMPSTSKIPEFLRASWAAVSGKSE
jgi:hypothetical protein